MLSRAVFALVCLALAAPALAQTPTASQFYMTYRAAFDKAKTVDDLLPYMSKKTIAQVEATPAAERAPMFEMMKTMGTVTDVKITKETKTANGVTLSVEALDPDKKKTTGSITIVKEGGAWKLDGESWSSSS